MSKLKIFRIWEFTNGFSDYTVTLNGQTIFKIPNGEFREIELEPGVHTLQAKIWGFWYSKPLKVILHENEEKIISIGSNYNESNLYSNFFFPFTQRKKYLYLTNETDKEYWQKTVDDDKTYLSATASYLNLFAGLILSVLPFTFYFSLNIMYLSAFGVGLILFAFISLKKMICHRFSLSTKLMGAAIFLLYPDIMEIVPAEEQLFYIASGFIISVALLEFYVEKKIRQYSR
jgi:hypothetical protein